MKKNDQMTNNDGQTTSGRVKQICQNFLEHSDFGLAQRLQDEEFAVHYDRNRTRRRESGLGVKTARVVEEEEKRALLSKQHDFYQQKQKEENDITLARRIQNASKIQSNVTNQGRTDIHRDHQNVYEGIDQPLILSGDTSNDEQLARILQEQEEEFSSSTDRSRFRSAFV